MSGKKKSKERMPHMESEQFFNPQESDSDEEIQEALAAGKLKPGLVVETQKVSFINDKAGLTDKLKEFALPKLSWVERLDLTSDPVPSVTDPTSVEGTGGGGADDDFQRELRFYRQAQASVLEGLARLAKLSIPTKRPDDYFAEMAKSDDHMKRVKAKLLEKKTSMERSEKAKKLREMKKYGKKVQHEVLLKRQKDKKEMLDSVKKFRKGQIDKIELMGETVERQGKQPGDKNFRPNKKREYKNKKFGFGGQKKRSKYNTAASSADVSDFSARRAHAKGPAAKKKNKSKQRPGKSRRNSAKNKRRN